MAYTPARKTSTRCRPSRRQLPRLGWWWLAVPLILAAAAKTWPAQAAITIVLAAAYLIARAIRPRYLTSLINRTDHLISTIGTRRRTLPNPGQRTLQAFLAMDPTQFEHAITELTATHPNIASAVHAGQTADRGLDVLATLHNGQRILIQCKRYTPSNNVGGDTVREIVGSVLAHRCDHGAIVTTANFTAEAYATNGTLGPHALTLIDGHTLEQWANGRHLPWR